MRFMLAAAAAALLASSVGCQSTQCGGGSCCPLGSSCGSGGCGGACEVDCTCGAGCGETVCDGCSGSGCGKCGGCGLLNALGGACDPSCCPCGPGDSVYDFQPGPPVGQVAYPYYTTRGPRDFLMANPPSIGPGGAYNGR